MDTEELVTHDDLESSLRKLYNKLEPIIRENTEPRKKWLRTKEVAEYLSISESRVHKFKAEGRISCKKLGGMNFYDRREIDKMLE